MPHIISNVDKSQESMASFYVVNDSAAMKRQSTQSVKESKKTKKQQTKSRIKSEKSLEK